MKINKGVMSIALMAIVFAGCVVASAISAHYFGKDNPIEEASEEIADEMVELSLDLPQGSVHLDFSGHPSDGS